MDEMRIEAGELRFGVIDYVPGRRMEPHWHDTTTVSLVLRGAVEEGVGAAEHQAGACGLVVKPAGTVHRNRFGPRGTRLATVELARGFEARVPGGVDALARWRWVDGGPAARVLWRLAATVHADPAAAARELEDRFWELADALGAADAHRDAQQPPWLRAVRERLHEEGGAAPRVRALADSAGVHPVYLARAFRRAYGLSITEYLRGLRVRAAAERLVEGREPLSQVAYGAGFADQAHLTRVLKRETGLTPRTLRRLAADGAPTSAGPNAM
jgi:AraC family transcriptional regulator